MRAGDDGDDAEEDAEEDDGVVVVVLATSRDRREAHLDGLAADAHASGAEAEADANGEGDDDDDGRGANGGGRRRKGETRATAGAIGDEATDIRGDEETRAGARERRRRRIAHARDAQRVGAQGWADVGELGTVFTK